MNAVAPPPSTQAGSHPIQFALLRLRHWPAIPQLPVEDMVDLARVCALLSWRATAGVIIARILGLPRERVQEILLLLHAQGCLNVQSQPAAGTPTPGATAHDCTADDAAPATEHSFITKIWQRLAARN